MFAFIRSALGLALVCAVALAAVSALGMQTPPGVFALTLAGAGCAQPCWQGIDPGATTRQGVVDLVQRSPFMRLDPAHTGDSQVVWAFVRGSSGTGTAYIEDGAASYVEIEGAFALGDLAADLGAPASATARYIADRFGRQRVAATFLYFDAALVLETPDTVETPRLLWPGLVVRRVTYAGTSFALDLDIAQPWRGFHLRWYD
ncbi:MAG: hypothetical protein JXB47_15335 [Anaerolineae bacterium]|nr:hypothetical protein [Anaerolineae bacterium]